MCIGQKRRKGRYPSDMQIKLVIVQDDGTTTTLEGSDWQSVRRSADALLFTPEMPPSYIPASQRSNPIDIALHFRSLQEQGLTQTDIARRFGLTPSAISNSLRILELPQNIQDLTMEGKLSRSHAVALCSLAHWPEQQQCLATQVISERWTSNRLEKFIARFKEEHADEQISPRYSRGRKT